MQQFVDVERSRPRAHDDRITTMTSARPNAGHSHEEGSMVSEYGLVAVLGATIAGLAISWAKGGAITSLLSAVLEQLHAVVGG